MDKIRFIHIDQSFNKSSLARCVTSNDVYLNNYLSDEEYRAGVIEKALEIAKNSSNFSPSIKTIQIAGKSVYCLEELASKLVLRKCAANIRGVADIRSKSRNKIIREIRSYLREGTPYRIYRFDIASFFENCDTDILLKELSNYRISAQTKKITESFLISFNTKYSLGIPRGIEISSVLSEICLFNADEYLKSRDEVLYHSRFVDDIIVITSAQENKREFIKSFKAQLPSNLYLNHNKTTVLDVPKRSTGMPPNPNPKIASFDYLGYSLTVTDTDLSALTRKPSSLKTKEYRDLTVDLTLRKLNRIKSKISKSFYSFTKNSDFRLLKDRIIFLATNRDMVDKNNNRNTIPTGVYFSHSEISYPSVALLSLDRFLVSMVLNPPKRIRKILIGRLTSQQKKELLMISFSNGFEKRIYKRYSPNRLREISKIW